MKISVVTPTYNSEKTILKNIDSVINQTYKEFEQIIVDNLSDDNTIEIVKNLYEKSKIINKLKIISERDKGISEAFNKGITAATGDVIAILNSDDIYFNKQVFETIADIFKDPEILFVHGDIYFDDPVYGSNIRKPLLCPVTKAMPYNHPSMFLRKEVYEKYGLYDLSYKYAMDYEFIIRIEKSLPNFKSNGVYYSEEPIDVMHAGGASWRNELKAIEESKAALKMHGFWNVSAKINYSLRVSRTCLKSYLSKLNLNSIVKTWRRFKWKN